MASNYPTSLDNFTNPTSNDSLNSPSHSLQHANINDAVEAIEAKLGIGASTAGSATSGQVLTAGTGGTTTWQTLTIPESGITLLNATTFATASSVIVDSVFSSTYGNYKMIIDFTAANSANGDISWYGRSGSPASDTTANYLSPYIRVFDTTVAGFKPTTGFLGAIEGTYASYASITADIIGPNLAKATKIFSTSSYRQDGGSTLLHTVTSWQTDSTQFTGIKIYPSGGTISGTLRIYGYRNS